MHRYHRIAWLIIDNHRKISIKFSLLFQFLVMQVTCTGLSHTLGGGVGQLTGCFRAISHLIKCNIWQNMTLEPLMHMSNFINCMVDQVDWVRPSMLETARQCQKRPEILENAWFPALMLSYFSSKWSWDHMTMEDVSLEVIGICEKELKLTFSPRGRIFDNFPPSVTQKRQKTLSSLYP